MVKRSLLPLLLSGLVIMGGCGKKGPIEPPLARAPQAVEKLDLIQRGSSLLLTWTNPSAYLDGNPLGELTEVEIWMVKEDHVPGTAAKVWTADEFESKAELLTRISADHFPSFRRPGASADKELSYAYSLAGDDIGRKVLTFSVRVRDVKKRASAFSVPASLEALSPPSSPRKVRAEVLEDHIQVTWESPEPAQKKETPPKAAGYNVYRSDGGNPASRVNAAPLEKAEFADKDFAFGQTYKYFVRAVLESTRPVESDDSETVEVTAKDAFPPAPPSGLTAIGGPGYIALSWEAGREPDLAGYRVWRRVAGEAEFVLVASLPETASSFSDSKVEKNKRYEYAIAALDSAGNESRKSDLVPGIVRDESLR